MINKINIKALSIVCSLLFASTLYASDALNKQDLALARDIDFDPRVLSMVSASGHRVEVLQGVGPTGNSRLMNGLVFSATEQQAHTIMARLGAEMEAMGYRLYIQELGYGYVPDRLAIIKSRDPFDILRSRRTHAYTAGLGTEQIVDKLKDWDKRYGLKIIGAGYDWVKAGLIRTPEDVNGFSREVLALCPDVLTFKSGTVAQLARDIKTDNSIFLQWK